MKTKVQFLLAGLFAVPPAFPQDGIPNTLSGRKVYTGARWSSPFNAAEQPPAAFFRFSYTP
ncbi:MAG: hypothetical protein ACKO2G_16140 [Verrucomicrobiales bacterium]